MGWIIDNIGLLEKGKIGLTPQWRNTNAYYPRATGLMGEAIIYDNLLRGHWKFDATVPIEIVERNSNIRPL